MHTSGVLHQLLSPPPCCVTPVNIPAAVADRVKQKQKGLPSTRFRKEPVPTQVLTPANRLDGKLAGAGHYEGRMWYVWEWQNLNGSHTKLSGPPDPQHTPLSFCEAAVHAICGQRAGE